MPDDPQVVSISSNASLTPDEIARRTFPAARRGVDAEAVKSFLTSVASDLRDQLDREAQLRRLLADAERRAAEPVIDDATLARAVGTETGKILQSAHEAARDLVERAEARAATLEAAAEESAQTVVESAAATSDELVGAAQSEAETVTEQAQEDAVALLEATKQECRQMIGEARALRIRVLEDLADRRRALHVQLEQLRTGKDSLIEVVTAVGLTVEELRDRLASADDDARFAAAEAARRAELAPDASQEVSGDLDELTELEEQLLGTTGGDQVPPEQVGGLDVDAGEDGESPASRRSVDELFARIRASRESAQAGPSEAESGADVSAGPAGAPEITVEDVRAAEESPEQADEPKDQPVVVAEPPPANSDAEAPSDDGVPTGAEAGTLSPSPGVAVEDHHLTEPDVEALSRRDQLLGPVGARLARALKRALQDDQNELLNALRHLSAPADLDLLQPADAQRERLVSATEAALGEAFSAGAAFLVEGDATGGPAVSAAAPTAAAAAEAGRRLATELATDIAGQLRERVERALSELGAGLEGGGDAAGAAYREWKGPRVEAAAGDYATRAFSTGSLAVLGALDPDAANRFRWVAEDDTAAGSCPDCDDNALAGAVEPGGEFPTGHSHPPAHPGCRCLLVLVRT